MELEPLKKGKEESEREKKGGGDKVMNSKLLH